MLNQFARLGWENGLAPKQRKRAKAIRRLTPADCKRLTSNGGVYDQSLTPDADSLLSRHSGLNHSDFREALGLELGRYRFAANMKAGAFSVSEHRRMLGEIVELTDELALRLCHLPLNAEAYSTELWRQSQGQSFDAFCSEMRSDLWKLRAVFSFVEKKIAKHGGRAGRKRDRARDTLVNDLLKLLKKQGMKKAQACELLHELLLTLSVPVPSDLDDFKKMTMRREKLEPIGGN